MLPMDATRDCPPRWLPPLKIYPMRAYAQVTLNIDRANGDLLIPAGTLFFTSRKPSVGVVRPNGTCRTLLGENALGFSGEAETQESPGRSPRNLAPKKSISLKARFNPGRRNAMWFTSSCARPP
jgi:hypothetical protein